MTRYVSLRVGTDVQSIDEVAQSIARFGARYTGRLFTHHEMDCCTGTPDQQAAGLSARFAAKEAMIKVLRPTDVIPRWKSIEVRRQPGGWCDLELYEEAAALARNAGLRDFAVSLSHGAGIGTATVIAKLTDESGNR
jgi:holo-[acyl-carrier protein] synthase